MVLFKLIGVYLGFYIAVWLHQPGLVGAVTGFVIGHALDIALLHKIQQNRARRYWDARASAQANQLYMTSIFRMIGRVCLIDGALKPTELAAVERITSEVFRLRRKDRKEAVNLVKSAAKTNTSMQLDAAQFLEMHKNEVNALENLILILFSVAVADQALSEEEEQLIQSAARVFGIPDRRYVELLMQHAPEYAQARYGRSQRSANGTSHQQAEPAPEIRPRDYYYSVLGCRREDSIETIKQKYRKLVTDYHPDKIVSKDLPPDFTAFATERFKAIQEAYEAVRSEKGFR